LTTRDRLRATLRLLALPVISAGVLTGCPGGGGGEPEPEPTMVTGSACGYIVDVGLFGGPKALRGCDQPPNAPATGRAPSVKLPPEGSATPITADDPDGGAAQYGPAIIVGGKWPCTETGDRNCTASAPPTGPMTVSTQGTLEGTVTSSATIGLHATPQPVGCYEGYGPNCYHHGGFGPFPIEGDEMNVTCTASAEGTTGEVTIKNGSHAISTTAEGDPKEQERVPDKPPVNYVRSGVITNVGDVFTAVYNEHVYNDDGSLTVNGVHMYLFGPTAVGEAIKGQATCGRIPATPPKDTEPPACGTLVVAPVSPQDTTPKSPLTELVGVFDARGLQAIENIEVTNWTVELGTPSGLPYLHFTPGQRGPLPVTATRTPEAEGANLPMEWSFDAVDKAGNRVHCPIARAPKTTAAPPSSDTAGATTTTTVPVGAPTTAPVGAPTTAPVGAPTTAGTTTTTRAVATSTTAGATTTSR
jgi:hypothetical protein